eukprot:m.478400 g.478400  ORF g.478400 m.478400 type:complete len:201 (+) comp21140_c0_seq1:3036-3638(+)
MMICYSLVWLVVLICTLSWHLIPHSTRKHTATRVFFCLLPTTTSVTTAAGTCRLTEQPSTMDQLTDVQIGLAREMFGLHSQGGSRLAQNKISLALWSLGSNATSAEVTKLTNNAADVEFPEFLEVYASAVKRGDGSSDILKAFQAYDKTGSGTIPTEDLKYLMSNMGEPLNPSELATLVQQADPSGSGQVDYKALVQQLF